AKLLVIRVHADKGKSHASRANLPARFKKSLFWMFTNRFDDANFSNVPLAERTKIKIERIVSDVNAEVRKFNGLVFENLAGQKRKVAGFASNREDRSIHIHSPGVHHLDRDST